MGLYSGKGGKPGHRFVGMDRSSIQSKCKSVNAISPTENYGFKRNVTRVTRPGGGKSERAIMNRPGIVPSKLCAVISGKDPYFAKMLPMDWSPGCRRPAIQGCLACGLQAKRLSAIHIA